MRRVRIRPITIKISVDGVDTGYTVAALGGADGVTTQMCTNVYANLNVNCSQLLRSKIINNTTE